MKQYIKNLISIAENIEDINVQCGIFDEVQNIIGTLADTINCPSDWRYVGEELRREYENNDFIYDSLKLWEYEDW